MWMRSIPKVSSCFSVIFRMGNGVNSICITSPASFHSHRLTPTFLGSFLHTEIFSYLSFGRSPKKESPSSKSLLVFFSCFINETKTVEKKRKGRRRRCSNVSVVYECRFQSLDKIKKEELDFYHVFSSSELLCS